MSSMNPYTIIRTLIAALVASINTHSNNQQDLVAANATIADLKDQLAKSREEAGTEAKEIAAMGDPLTADEQAHIEDVLTHIAAQPAPVVPIAAPPIVASEPAPSEPVVPPEVGAEGPADQPFIPSNPFFNPTPNDFSIGEKVKVTKSFFDAAKVGDEGVVKEKTFDGKYTVTIDGSDVVLPGDCLEAEEVLQPA